jgi:hypothetical protein
MDTIVITLFNTAITFLVFIIGWVYSNFQIIGVALIAMYVLRDIERKFAFYGEKILDIDERVEQIAKSVGAEESED